MRVFFKNICFLGAFFICCAVSADPQALMASANQKLRNATSPADCLESKDSCPKAMADWVNDDKSWGLLPSYEKLEICRTSETLKKITNTSSVLGISAQAYPQINEQAVRPATVCSSGNIDLDRKATFKSIYFLARLERGVSDNVTQLAAYDAFLNDKDKSLAQINCNSSAFKNIESQCQKLLACPTNAAQQTQQFADDVARIEKENKLIDESAKILKSKTQLAHVKSNNYALRGGRDPKIAAELKALVTKLEEQSQILAAMKKANLQAYPVLTNEEYMDARDDEKSVAEALRITYSAARKKLLEQTKKYIDKSLCAVTIRKKGCSPSDLNEILVDTPRLAEINYGRDKMLAPFAEGVIQQSCIFDNVIDRKNVTRKIVKETLHAGVDIGLTLIPGGAALVFASRAKMAAEIGVNAAKAATRAAQLTEGANAVVSVAWLGKSSLDAIDACQAKYKQQKTQPVNSTDLCVKASVGFFNVEKDSTDCAKAVVFAAMDGLPIVGQAASYAKRSGQLTETLASSQRAAGAVQETKAAAQGQARAFKEIEIQNPQQQIWRAQSSADKAQAARVESIVRTELETGKIVSSKLIVSEGNIPIGRSGAKFVKYESGIEGVWKANVKGENSTSAEMATAIMDQHLGAGQVPLTVAKELDGVAGTVQLKINGLQKASSSNPQELQLTDYLNSNSDRTMPGNHVETADGKAVAIDGGRAFIIREGSGVKYGYANNPIEPKLVEIERGQQRISKTEADLKKLSDGTASEAFKMMNPEEQLQKELRDLKKRQATKVAETKAAMKRMIPNDQWVAKLRSTSRADWDRLLGQQLSPAQINELVTRQQDILRSIDRSKSLLSAPHKPNN